MDTVSVKKPATGPLGEQIFVRCRIPTLRTAIIPNNDTVRISAPVHPADAELAYRIFELEKAYIRENGLKPNAGVQRRFARELNTTYTFVRQVLRN